MGPAQEGRLGVRRSQAHVGAEMTTKRLALAIIEVGEAMLESLEGSGAGIGSPPPVTASSAAPSDQPNPPQCPTHHRDWKFGKFGWFCTAQAAPGERADKRGYCAERPR